jgi:exonuclease VII large subunit
MKRVKKPTTKQEQALRSVKQTEEFLDAVMNHYLNPNKESFDLTHLYNKALELKKNLNRDYVYVTVTKEMEKDLFE